MSILSGVNLTRYYFSITKYELKPQAWTPVEEAIWTSAITGNPKVVFTSNFDDNYTAHMKTLKSYGLLNINLTFPFTLEGYFYQLEAEFPALDYITNWNNLYATYVDSRRRRLMCEVELTGLGNKCCEILDQLCADVQIATNNGERYVFIRSPNVIGSMDEPFNLAVWHGLEPELKRMGLKYRRIKMPMYLWTEEWVLVWGWTATNLPSNYGLSKKDLPEYLHEYL